MEKKKIFNLWLFYFISFIYMEILLKILTSAKIVSISIINLLFFNIALSFFLTIITKLFKSEKINKIIFYSILIFNFIWFSASYVLKKFFGFYLTFATFNLADQIANGFTGDAVNVVLYKIGGIILMGLPLIFAIIFRKKLNFKNNKIKKIIILLIFLLISSGLYCLSLYIGKNKDYSAYELVYNINDLDTSVTKLGAANTLFLDINRTIFGFEDKIIIEKKEKKEKEVDEEPKYVLNNQDIDFESIMTSTNDQTIKTMTEYFMNETGTYTNDYTGIFKGKNLILFMAESFNGVAVSEELTPTLYKLANNGFVFEKFYTPTVYSTIGGEFQELTGLFAGSLNVLSKFRDGTNSFPYGIGTLFNNAGYNTYAYHDSFRGFQDRNDYLASLGITNYEGCNDDTNEMECYPWPGSDITMIESTFNKYSDSENPFMVFYATVSGHGDYTDSSSYYKKYKEQLDAYYPNATVNSKAYVAGQMELDKALEKLLSLLEEKGILDDTVIALVGDHAPYYLYEKSINYINDISTYTRDNKIELFRSNFILYNSTMEKVNVTKVGSQIDVIPTIYNVFNLPYDSRLFIGKDILSTEPGLAIMSDNSWVSDKGYYVAGKGFTKTVEEELDTEYQTTMNNRVKNKVSMSKNIILKDYYKELKFNNNSINNTETKDTNN